MSSPIGEGRSVARVRVPDAQRKDLAFEAVLSAQGDEPIFAGLTGYTRGEEGDRSGQVVLVYDRDAQSKFVIVAESREDTRICGQATTPLGARGLDAHTMQLRGATLHRIDKKARDAAQRVIAQPRTSTTAPLARVLVATGGSAPAPAALTDGKLDTAWSEQRPGDGHGEFVTMRAPSELPIHSLVVTIAPGKPKPEGAAPRTFFVATRRSPPPGHDARGRVAEARAGLRHPAPFARANDLRRRSSSTRRTPAARAPPRSRSRSSPP